MMAEYDLQAHHHAELEAVNERLEEEVTALHTQIDERQVGLPVGRLLPGRGRGVGWLERRK